MAVAVHEFGHSHGLSHDMKNQISATDGTGSTMFPFIDTAIPATSAGSGRSTSTISRGARISIRKGPRYPGRPRSEEATGRSAASLASSPEKSGMECSTSLSPGPACSRRIAKPGPSCRARSAARHRSPSIRQTGQHFVIDPAFNIIDGRYAMPVPAGRYAVGIEPLDGFPVPAGSISLVAPIGSLFGQQNFNEEFYSRATEAAIESERRPATVRVNMGEIQSGIDIVTGRDINVNRFGARTRLGSPLLRPVAIYVHRIPAQTIADINPGQDVLVKSLAFDTLVLDASVVPLFATAMLTTGTVNAA